METYSACGIAMQVIACIEAPLIDKQILEHQKDKADNHESR